MIENRNLINKIETVCKNIMNVRHDKKPKNTLCIYHIQLLSIKHVDMNQPKWAPHFEQFDYMKYYRLSAVGCFR